MLPALLRDKKIKKGIQKNITNTEEKKGGRLLHQP